ncbi:MAG: CRISPR-associated endoribonuclease Cas6 [Methanomicrobia archaeon]|nr:CRISPR-associated endoribonuclease Cas6 [Methanomicrobia archaeon]
MRLKFDIVPEEDFSYWEINKHTIQGMIYSHLWNTEYKKMHEEKKFKFFSFSDIFPPTDFKKGEEKNFIISSPDRDFIEVLYRELKSEKYLYFGKRGFMLKKINKFNLPLKKRFITGSPIVLYQDNRENLYFSFERNPDLSFFLERLKDNALKKYNAFYRENFTIENMIFDKIIFGREVVVPMIKRGNKFIIIGSTWKTLEKFKYTRDEQKVYKFIMDCGLGEKNSLGFGFLNPVREKQKNSKALIIYEYD